MKRANSVCWTLSQPGQISCMPYNSLYGKNNFPKNRTIFAGDSGNDLDVLTSGMNSILVKNALEDVRKEAIKKLSDESMIDRLYLPQGNFFGMNGNYAAGVLEGLARFIPETGTLIAEAVKHIKSFSLTWGKWGDQPERIKRIVIASRIWPNVVRKESL